jgi:hypothetical protein
MVGERASQLDGVARTVDHGPLQGGRMSGAD